MIPKDSLRVSYSLKSLKGVIQESIVGLITGDTRDSDYSSAEVAIIVGLSLRSPAMRPSGKQYLPHAGVQSKVLEVS